MKPRRTVPRAAAALAVVAALLLSACTASGGGKYYTFTSATAIGKLIPVADRKPAEDIGGTLLSGGKTTLQTTAGKVVVVNFWASWCAPCQVETPQLGALYKQVHSSGVDFLGVDFKDRAANGRSFVKNHDITYPILYDQQGDTAIKLGNPPAAGLPFTFLLDKQGRVAAVYIVRFTMVDLQAAIEKLRAES